MSLFTKLAQQKLKNHQEMLIAVDELRKEKLRRKLQAATVKLKDKEEIGRQNTEDSSKNQSKNQSILFKSNTSIMGLKNAHNSNQHKFGYDNRFKFPRSHSTDQFYVSHTKLDKNSRFVGSPFSKSKTNKLIMSVDDNPSPNMQPEILIDDFEKINGKRGWKGVRAQTHDKVPFDVRCMENIKQQGPNARIGVKSGNTIPFTDDMYKK